MQHAKRFLALSLCTLPLLAAQACQSRAASAPASTAPPQAMQSSPVPEAPAPVAPEATSAAQPPPVSPAPDAGSTIDWELKGAPAVVSMARRSSYRLTVVATNRGTAAATPQLSLGQLTVNGEPSFAFGLAFGNGVMEKGWTGLQPGEHVEMSRDLGDALFEAPGDYVLVFTNGGSTSTVKVRVTR